MEAKDKIKILSGHLEETDIIVINEAIEEARKAGMKEVVEWIKSKMALPRTYLDTTYPDINLTVGEWQVKLKEWGIE